MNKKIISRIIVIITMLGLMMVGNKSKAYVGSGYTIDIPSTYIKTSVTSGEAWAKSTGDNLNIQVMENTSGEVANYTTLNESIETLKKELSSTITMDKSEVTSINGYDCIHLIYKYSGISLEQYAIPTKDKIYVLTLAGVSSDYLNSTEARGIVNSFKITNYEKPGSSSSTGTSTGSNNTINNTISNTTTNSVNNTTDDDDKNTSKNETDDDDDEDENKTSKKKKSSDDDDEDNNWIIVAIIAGAAVLCVAIIGIVIAVVVSKNKNKNQY